MSFFLFKKNIAIFAFNFICSVYMYSVCHYSVSDSVRHKNVVLLYVHGIKLSIFVLYVTLCLFGGP
jgi:hypothetical protein